MDIDYTDIFKFSFWILYIISVLSTVIVILIDNKSPYKATSWLLVVLLIPFVGLIFYFLFGEELRRKKLISKKSIKRLKQISGYYDNYHKKQFRDLIISHHLSHIKEFIYLLNNNSNSKLYDNNKIDLLNTPQKCYDDMFIEIEKAQHHIHLEYYIFKNDNVGKKFIKLLIQKAKEGVEVRMILDSVGSWSFDKKYIKKLSSNGVKLYFFLRVRFPFLTKRINNRNHRKILIIDGKIGYTGGVNISTKYIAPINKGIWRDMHIKIKGDSVKTLQSVFLIDWYFVSRKELIGKEYYPIIEEVGSSSCQIVSSAPDADWETVMQAFIKLIVTAKKYIYIHTPYFIPTDSVMDALKIAGLSGVDVRIVIPKNSDINITKISSGSYIQTLLDAGIKVYQYTNGFIHSKAFLVDDLISSVGTTNMDFRSFEQNFEVNAFIYDKAFAKKLKAEFDYDFSISKLINPIAWKRRPRHVKLIEGLSRILNPLL